MYDDDVKILLSLIMNLAESGNPCYAVLIMMLVLFFILWRRKR